MSKQRKYSSHQAGAHRGTAGEQRQAHVIRQQTDKEKNNIIEGIVNVTSASCYRRKERHSGGSVLICLTIEVLIDQLFGILH